MLHLIKNNESLVVRDLSEGALCAGLSNRPLLCLYTSAGTMSTHRVDPGNPLLARSYDNLAVTEAMLEKYGEAEPLYREALKLRDGEDAASLHNLALVLVARNKPADADALYSRALAVLDASGNENPDLLKLVLVEYSSLLRDLKAPG
jgi:tetratricopeptide (TPR) repeat protein